MKAFTQERTYTRERDQESVHKRERTQEIVIVHDRTHTRAKRERERNHESVTALATSLHTKSSVFIWTSVCIQRECVGVLHSSVYVRLLRKPTRLTRCSQLRAFFQNEKQNIKLTIEQINNFCFCLKNYI